MGATRVIREALEGKRIVLTGVTGFLGTALLERLLTDTGVARIDAVSRGNATERVAALLIGQAFAPARDRIGGEALWQDYQARVRPISADLDVAPPPVDPDVDLVIHAAATVSFDPPIDEAFRTNLMGSVGLYEAAGGTPFVHVSTAYVAGITRGTQPEELLARGLDWRAEAASAENARAHAEEASRRPERLEAFSANARSAVGRAGPQSVAARAEELRCAWVHERLVRAGTARARSLGWPDVYAFTKSLTEQALDEMAGDNPLTIVRPSIIESAHRHPYPGWIEGFRVAEPVILAYGRGALPEFPGIPEGVMDIIPVDHVVNCVLAAAAEILTQRPRRRVYHISSGGRNPMPFRTLYEITREYFLTHPLPERGRGQYKVPTWTFPGTRAVEKKMRAAERFVEGAERVVARMPRGSATRETARKVDRLRGRLDFAKKYAALYGHYVEVEVIYTDDRAVELFQSLPPKDREDFCFDPTVFTWEEYLGGIHLPAITAPMRWAASLPSRPTPAVVVAPRADTAPPVLAAFDLEGTVVQSNVVETYLWLRLAEASGGGARAREIARLAAAMPRFLDAERRDRGEFLRLFYRQYEGASVEEVRALAARALGDLFLRKLSAAAVRRIKEHRDAGHTIVFITGSLDFVVAPLAGLADVVTTARLRERDGRFIGDLERPPLVGEARASWLRDYARSVGASLPDSYAYADSMSDLPLLEVVGHAVAVNPDTSLGRVARAKRWPVEEWTAGHGTPRIMLPEPVLR